MKLLIHSQISTVAPLKFGIPKLQRLHRWSLGWMSNSTPPFYNWFDYLSMLGLKLNHVSKRGPWNLLTANHPPLNIAVGTGLGRLACWCAHRLLWRNLKAPMSIFQESPLAGEPRERLFYIHSVHRYQLCRKYHYPSTLLLQINGCNL